MVGEKASPAKKNPRLRLTLFAVVALIVVERRAFNSLLPRIFFCFQVRSKLWSVRLLHLHLWPNFWTWLRLQLIRMKLDWNNRTVVLVHLHHLVWIQSHTRYWRQHLLCILNQLSPTGVLPALLPKLDNPLLVLHQIALPDPHLKTIVVNARKNIILFYVPR